MKFKKILSSVVATAMAVSTFSAFATTTATAEASSTNYITIDGATTNYAVNFQSVVEKQTIEEGTKTYEFSFDLGYSDTLLTSSSQYNGVEILLVDTTGSQCYEDISIDVIVDGEEKLSDAVPTYNQYAWDSNSSAIVSGYEYCITDADSETIGTINSNITFRVTVTYEIPTTDIWVDNGDGSYTLTRGTAENVPNYELKLDSLCLVTSVSLDVSVENGDTYSNGGFGAMFDDGTAEGTWSSENWGETTTTCTLESDYEMSSNPQFQVWYAPAGAEITISNIQVEYDIAAYTQESSDKTAVRTVMLITEEEAKEATSVEFTFSNGTNSVVLESTKCYSKITAAGDTLTAPEGYVFVAYAISGIPDGTTVTCEKVELK